MKRAIFLDRDGTLNLSYDNGFNTSPPSSISEITIIDGVVAGLEILRGLNFEIITVTNQPDFKRGNNSLENLVSINKTICELVDIKYSYVCFHDEPDGCDCRKPKNGLILQAAQDLNIDLSKSYLIGDRITDVEAGIKSGCTCYLITNQEIKSYLPFTRVGSLFQASKLISKKEGIHG
jgi:D-glycero-D-manno-heptose 1,7-bisphosphate phosphatase